MMNRNLIQTPFLTRQHPSITNPFSEEGVYPIEDPRVVNRLVNNLMYLFKIHDGDYLTFVLGHGECSTNKKALQLWVYEQLSGIQNADDALDTLISRLKDQLMMEVYQ
ncbi:hypothetical protein [Thiomicrorhabdus sediminis]|uniref:Uncharacterized protein n=1 Tax=Thiomicrorhabdus sediminis TaxID=2580412 RepID=A0A4P9K7C6_9GAMM|nr:hypothetical protein [Thiomicrorhabdus sediminis]QCU91002.1 hypothetical protein FE785_10385 [Thiomicrorhabdus sediminis]